MKKVLWGIFWIGCLGAAGTAAGSLPLWRYAILIVCLGVSFVAVTNLLEK